MITDKNLENLGNEKQESHILIESYKPLSYLLTPISLFIFYISNTSGIQLLPFHLESSVHSILEWFASVL